MPPARLLPSRRSARSCSFPGLAKGSGRGPAAMPSGAPGGAFANLIQDLLQSLQPLPQLTGAGGQLIVELGSFMVRTLGPEVGRRLLQFAHMTIQRLLDRRQPRLHLSQGV